MNTHWFRLVAVCAGLGMALPMDAAPEAQNKSPLTLAQENAALTARYSRSIVTVRYFLKVDADGREPKFEVPYKCPNCHETHWRDNGSSAGKEIPGEFAGFLIASDRVLMKDLMLDPAFIARIEVVCGDETRAAAEFESVPERRALILKTETPFAQAKPLAFTGGPAPADPRYFYLVREDGLTVSGVTGSKMAAFKHYVEPNLSLYEGNANTLVLDAKGDPVTVALDEKIVLGQEAFTPPTAWKTEPVERRTARRNELLARIRRSVLPVHLQFEAKGRDDDRRSISFSLHGSSEVKNDVDAVGVVFAGGRVAVLAKLAASDTARLAKIEATLPDGKQVPLTFEGSYVEEGALAATFAEGLPAGVEPMALDGRRAVELFNGEFAGCSLLNAGGTLKQTPSTARVTGFERIRGNVYVPKFEQTSGLRDERSFMDDRAAKQAVAVLSTDAKLIFLKVSGRHESGDKGVQGAQLAAMAGQPVFDPENVPRTAENRRRTPWLGVDVQTAGADVIREKKATQFFRDSDFELEHAALVTEVAPGSPAAQLGIKTGDILLTVKYPDAARGEPLRTDLERFSGIDWEKVFGDDRFIEAGSSGEVTPWPNVEGGINGTLVPFGVGTEVEISWVSDGKRRTGRTKLALAPVHFRNAPRVRSKDLSITVCDMTAEVRKYFKFDDKAPGVVIAKVKSGGTGAVAGLRPLEIITEVNSVGVTSAKDFLEKTKGRKDLNFAVRRLSTTRIVPIKLP